MARQLQQPRTKADQGQDQVPDYSRANGLVHAAQRIAPSTSSRSSQSTSVYRVVNAMQTSVFGSFLKLTQQSERGQREKTGRTAAQKHFVSWTEPVARCLTCTPDQLRDLRKLGKHATHCTATSQAYLRGRPLKNFIGRQCHPLAFVNTRRRVPLAGASFP
jgi:hypothetical protein